MTAIYPVPRELEGTQACAGSDTAAFFPPPALHGAPVEKAKAPCRACPFLDPCLAYALDRPAIFGIWGATTHRERHEMRKRLRKAS